MSEQSGQEIVEGWWCNQCDFFEGQDDVDTTKDQCQACGCNGASHIPVVIVGK